MYVPHTLVQLSGTLGPEGNPAEIWSIGFRVTSRPVSGGGTDPGFPTFEETEEYLAAITPRLKTAIDNVAALNTSGLIAKVDTIKANAIDQDGHYEYDVTNLAEVAWAFGPVANAVKYPFQISKVITLETGRSRGLAARGRVYVPAPTNALASTGLVSLASGELTAYANIVNALNDDTTADRRWRVSVVSSAGTGFSDGYREVTAVSMDTVLDTQRRRAKDLVGTRYSTPL